MDIMTGLRYVFDHNQQVIAALIIVILITAIVLFIRALSQEKSEVSNTRSGSDFDIGAIESALKRVMAAQTGALAAAAATAAASAASASAPRVEVAASANADRDAKVQELAREIDRLTKELAAKGSSPFAASAAPDVDQAKVTELQEKIDELQGKLSEYEIIEDDIADLSRFKEENAELRRELEQLKKTATVKPEAISSAAPPEPAAAAPAAVPQASSSATVTSHAEIDPGDLVMKEFASSIQIQSVGGDGSSILGDTLDTDKMLSEAAGLTSIGQSDENALGGVLDTEKLMDEVGSLKVATSPSPSSPAASPAATKPAAPAPQPAPEAVVFNAGGGESTDSLEDDLLAEFKDSNEEGQ